ncbi:putative alanyl-tRNA synthetase [Boeremia exigua]|uniref:putative alanyl-tRNA synthetase n=1 Tax=Boeremia exigua TaxID=749465 RepID=UPI001E8DAB80|nr:putative alanyl-tRNA synthetase [Boeremia exigua]KAH6611906.1 putative alanyl-tRNA synthetase [Boeremia exigua]
MTKETHLNRTTPVYEASGDLRTFQTKIVAVIPVGSLLQQEQSLFKHALPSDVVIATEGTIFHAQGGGQPSDTGTMISRGDDGSVAAAFQVQAVRRNGHAVIFHQGLFDTSDTQTASSLVGSTVDQTIDSDKRDYHSRIHTGGHLLGLAVRQLRSEIPEISEIKAQHFPGAAFVEFRGKIDGKFKDKIQEVLNKLISQDLPVSISWMDQQQLRQKGIHVPDGFSKDSTEEGTRVVEIGNLGGYPCGGTHVHSTSALVKVVVRKIAASKGNTKISYEVD